MKKLASSCLLLDGAERDVPNRALMRISTNLQYYVKKGPLSEILEFLLWLIYSYKFKEETKGILTLQASSTWLSRINCNISVLQLTGEEHSQMSLRVIRSF